MTKMTNVVALNAVLEMALADDVREKITAIRDSYVKKSQYKSNKPTATQVANEGLKADIVAYLTEVGGKHTIAEFIKNIPSLADATPQKVAPMMAKLCESGLVVREDIKRKAHYSIVE